MSGYIKYSLEHCYFSNELCCFIKSAFAVNIVYLVEERILYFTIEKKI